MESLCNHNYKQNLIYITWTSYMAIISSTINLSQMKTAVTITSSNSLLANPPLIKPPPKTQFPNWKLQPLLMWVDFIFPIIWIIGVTFSMD